jgi:ParB-like chromosome segregation protein Spo0J
VKDLQFHDAANIFPLISGDEFDELVDDIRKHGLREPIKLLDGKVLDGRNRYRACLLIPNAAKYETVQTDDPVAYVVSLNKHRRQLTPSQLSMVGARIKEYYANQAKERMAEGGKHKGKENLPYPVSDKGQARDLAGKAVGVSGKSIDHAARVLEKGIPELAKAVDEGRMAVSTAAILATESPEVQAEEIANPKRNRVYTNNSRVSGKPAGVIEATSANEFATMAISQLERVRLDDPKREEAFSRVEKWLLSARMK